MSHPQFIQITDHQKRVFVIGESQISYFAQNPDTWTLRMADGTDIGLTQEEGQRVISQLKRQQKGEVFSGTH